MDQNNNGYFPQGSQQYPQQAPQQQYPQQGYNPNQQPYPQQPPQQGYNYGAPQQVPQQMNYYGGGYGYAPVPQQKKSNGLIIGIVCGVVGLIVLGVILFFVLGNSSSEEKITGSNIGSDTSSTVEVSSASPTLDSMIIGKWTCENETIVFKSDRSFDLYESGSLYYSGTWNISYDNTLTLVANTESSTSTLVLNWVEPGESYYGSGYYWSFDGSTLNVSGDDYTRD